MNALIGYEGSINFESDRITLDIPEEGISDHKGWKLSQKLLLQLVLCMMYVSMYYSKLE